MKKTLSGKNILVTRPKDQAETLVFELEQLGACVLVQPAIEISDPDSWQFSDECVREIDQYDWVLFAGKNGVRFFGERYGKIINSRIAVTGPETARLLREQGYTNVVFPETAFHAEGLVDLLKYEACEKKRFLIVRGDKGRSVLQDTLAAWGGKVDLITVYSSRHVKQTDPIVFQKLQIGEIDWVTVTSSEIARALVKMFGDTLKKSRLVSISPITSATLSEFGFSPSAEAGEATISGVIHAILDQETSRNRSG